MIVTLVMGSCWLEFIIDLIIDIVTYIHMTTGLSNFYLGMTLIASANTCVDLFVDMALSSTGLEIMAVTGIFSGQMFNLLFGFSLCGVLKIIFTEHQEFHLFRFSDFWTITTQTMILLLVCALIVMLSVYFLLFSYFE